MKSKGVAIRDVKVYIHLMGETDFRECSGCLCFAARRAARAITQLYDRHLRPSGLRSTQFTLLAYLLSHGPTPLLESAEFLGVERTTLTRNLRPLHASKLLAIDTGKDRRIKMISITAEGRRAAMSALPLWRMAQTEARQRSGDFSAISN